LFKNTKNNLCKQGFPTYLFGTRLGRTSILPGRVHGFMRSRSTTSGDAIANAFAAPGDEGCFAVAFVHESKERREVEMVEKDKFHPN
jgi:hypothetical protein